MMTQLFSACQFIERCDAWQEAVHVACYPLCEQGLILPAYSQAIITATEQYGPWYILSQEFALPHARPEEGVLSKDSHLSLLCTGSPVAFPGHPDIRIIIVLAAADSRQHIEKIQQLVCWLDEDNHLKQLATVNHLAQVEFIISGT